MSAKPHSFSSELRMTKFDRTTNGDLPRRKAHFSAHAKPYSICRPCIVALFSITVQAPMSSTRRQLGIIRACQLIKGAGSACVNVKFGTHSDILQLQMDTPLGVLYGGWAHSQLQTQIYSKSTRPKLLRFPFVSNGFIRRLECRRSRAINTFAI